MRGTIKLDVIVSKKFVVFMSVSDFIRSILKSPSRKIFFIFFSQFFHKWANRRMSIYIHPHKIFFCWD